eukprot:scaffold1390_cov138-Cylindrotheca_fusiformis.AAC.18
MSSLQSSETAATRSILLKDAPGIATSRLPFTEITRQKGKYAAFAARQQGPSSQKKIDDTFSNSHEGFYGSSLKMWS